MCTPHGKEPHFIPVCLERGPKLEAKDWHVAEITLLALCAYSWDTETSLTTPAASHTAAFTIPASLGGTELSFLICNFLPLPCPYFLLFTAVLEEFQEANLLSAFTDVSPACPRCSSPVSFGAQCPFPLPAPRLVPGASWYHDGRACLAVFLSFQEKFDIVVSFVRNVSRLKRKHIFLLKNLTTKKAPGGRKPPPEVLPGGKACSGLGARPGSKPWLPAQCAWLHLHAAFPSGFQDI